MLICENCEDNNAFSGESKVCGYALQGGETIFIKPGYTPDDCPRRKKNDYKNVSELWLLVDKMLERYHELNQLDPKNTKVLNEICWYINSFTDELVRLGIIKRGIKKVCGNCMWGILCSKNHVICKPPNIPLSVSDREIMNRKQDASECDCFKWNDKELKF